MHPGIEADGKIRYARVYHLWAMGVGAVVSGDFFGWQACLAGGFVGEQTHNQIFKKFFKRVKVCMKFGQSMESLVQIIYINKHFCLCLMGRVLKNGFSMN